jgi:PAS domain S-box-containing protein
MPEHSAQTAAAVRIGFVHIDALCWTFFQYHLTILGKHAGVQIVDRPVHTLRQQVAEIENLINERVDVLLFRPMVADDPALLATLKRAQAQGMRLIAIDGLPGGELDVTSIVSDNLGGQSAVADLTFRRMGGKGKVAYLQGDLRTDAGQLRDQGFQSVLQRYPNIELVFTAAFDWSTSVFSELQGLSMAREALCQHPDLDAILTAADEGAIGVIKALDEQGRKGRVWVTGFDGVPEGLIAVADGDLLVTALQPLDHMAAHAFDLSLRLLRDQGAPVTHHTLAVKLVTADDIADGALRALRMFPELTRDLSRRGAQLQSTTQFLDALLDNMPIMLFMKDAKDLRYVRVNKARENWLACSKGSHIGKTAFDFYPADLAQKFEATDRAVIANGVLDVREEESFQEGVGKRYVNTHKIPLFDSAGQATFLLGISEDITDRKLAEQALAQRVFDLQQANLALQQNHERLLASEKMAALGSLVAGVAHELNTPIGNALVTATTFRDHTRMLLDQFQTGLTRAALKNFLDQATQASDMLERNLHRASSLIQSFKQIAVDQASSGARTFSLATVVTETMLALSPTLKNRPIEVVQDIPANLTMYSFPGPLEQVLMNLVNNAVLHGFDVSAQGTIRIIATTETPESVRLTVQDDGVGIEPAHLTRIYDPFFSTKFGSGGSGLGLSICHNIVTGVLGGRIDVSSRLGEGTRFDLSLPMRIDFANR